MSRFRAADKRVSDVKRSCGEQKIVPTQKGRVLYATLTASDSPNDRHFMNRFFDIGPVLPNPNTNAADSHFVN